jgi:FlaA1/EpsC-like NDP-sugar epimerase
MNMNTDINVSMFSNNTLLITGGTGLFGYAVLRRFLDSGMREIGILSRKEKYQDDKQKRYKLTISISKFLSSTLGAGICANEYLTFDKIEMG